MQTELLLPGGHRTLSLPATFPFGKRIGLPYALRRQRKPKLTYTGVGPFVLPTVREYSAVMRQRDCATAVRIPRAPNGKVTPRDIILILPEIQTIDTACGVLAIFFSNCTKHSLYSGTRKLHLCTVSTLKKYIKIRYDNINTISLYIQI